MPAATDTSTPRVRSRFGARRAWARGAGRRSPWHAATHRNPAARSVEMSSLRPEAAAWNSVANRTGTISLGSWRVAPDPWVHGTATLPFGPRLTGRGPWARLHVMVNRVRTHTRPRERPPRTPPRPDSKRPALTFRKLFFAKALRSGPCDRGSPRSGAWTAADGFPGSHGPAEGRVKRLRVNFRLPSRFRASMCPKERMIPGEPRPESGAPPGGRIARPGGPRTGLLAREMPDPRQSRLLRISGDAS
jgi:hypothetical protein